MCFWNAPLNVPDHERYAVKSALEMIDALDKLNAGFEKNFGICLSIGIGLHSGLCRVGNMGSKDIFEYTAIGDSVNLASRLEGLTKFYQVPIILSESMLSGVGEDMMVTELDLVQVKGKDLPVRIFTVSGSGEEFQRTQMARRTELYHQALDHYKKAEFEKGRPLFKRLVSQYPDVRLYQLYLERCDLFIEKPPSPDWNGVFIHTSK